MNWVLASAPLAVTLAIGKINESRADSFMCSTVVKATLAATIFVAAAPGYSATHTELPAEFLKAHNKIRAGLGLPLVRWSEQLARVAKDWALTLLVRSQFQHSRAGYGENLFEVRGAKASPLEAVEAWASEAANYDYQGNRCRAGQCGHYTQIVWRTSIHIGCANVTCNSLQYKGNLVCNYGPGGNSGGAPY